MRNVVGHEKFALTFCPEQWSWAEKLSKFYGAPYPQNRRAKSAVSSCVDHRRKYHVLARLANRLRGTLIQDQEEMDTVGHTAADRSQEYAALFEVLVCELYSVLDGMRYTAYEFFSGCRGVQQNSTSKFFSHAAERRYGPEFSEEIRAMLATAYADWFVPLRELRTALTHGGLGTCLYDLESNKISYSNSSLGNSAQARKDDVEGFINVLAQKVFALEDDYFEHFYRKLMPSENHMMCGFYHGKAYFRQVMPLDKLAWDSGRCVTRQHFNADADYYCPLTADCAAYAAAEPVSLVTPPSPTLDTPSSPPQ